MRRSPDPVGEIGDHEGSRRVNSSHLGENDPFVRLGCAAASPDGLNIEEIVVSNKIYAALALNLFSFFAAQVAVIFMWLL